MNKLGFYIEVSIVPFLREALAQVKPPTILFHAGDRGLLHEIRRGLSPDSFIIGRWYVPLDQQNAWLTDPDPEARGRDMANTILRYDFGYATEKVNGRLLIDAWMSLNESVPGPASFPNEQVSDEFKHRAAALDRFQVAFRDQLQTAGLEAVAFNFGAGNYTKAEHYLQWFPKTLQTYKYLGFHEYGWPTLMPQPGTATAALLYRTCMAGIRNKYGDRHRVIITEAGLARMYKYPQDPAGDVGWLYRGETISEEQYWKSLEWYNKELCKDAYVKGACLFEVGHSGSKWESFRHLGVDNAQQPILLMDKIAKLNEPNGNGNGDGDGNGNVAQLRQRIAQLKTSLTTAAGQIAGIQAQVSRLGADLEKLAKDAAPLADLARRASDLPVQINALRSLVEQSSLSNKATLLAQLAALFDRMTAIQPDANRAATLPGQLDAMRDKCIPVVKAAEPLPGLEKQVGDLLAEVIRLEQELPGGGPPAEPTWTDLTQTLPKAADKSYPQRGLADIKRVIVHHTGTKPDVTPLRIAQAQVSQGKAGITYHFLVAADGALYRTQPFELAIEQTLVSAVNADGAAVALIGNFTDVTPPPAQLAAAARLIAWLLKSRGLGIAAVFGRRELDGRSASPGNQWQSGAKYRDTLLAAVQGQM
jgi:hypothetical protein